MKWTSDKPTKPGFYWYRGGTILGMTKPTLQYIDDSGENDGKMALWSSEDFALADLDGDWYGPLTPPRSRARQPKRRRRT